MDAVTEIALQDQDQDLFFTFKAEGLPDAELAVREFTLEERTFQPFTLEVALVSKQGDLDLTAMMDKPALVTAHDRYRDKKRYFHGVVAAASRGDSGARHTFYHLTLMPALHRLRFTSDSRIFQSQTIPQIIETLLSENNVSDYKLDLRVSREPREFCVQYRETDLAFVERLMAEEGMHYYHEHREDGHTLVISDTSMEAKAVEDGEIEYNATRGGEVKGPYIRSFRWREEVRPTRVALKDYTFKQPQAPMLMQAQTNAAPGHAQDYEIYDFPGRHKKDDDGRQFAQWRLEGLRCETSAGTGEGYCVQLQAGRAFTLKEHDDRKLNREYFVVETSHHGTQPGAVDEDAGEETTERGTQLVTHFKAIPVSTPWRPEQRTKPQAEGPHIAIVSGPPGEQIYTDEYGRVKVQFPWDRYGKNDDTSSCWIRVSQAWGGGTFGNVAIPRIGQEVIVDYLGCDPDQPIIVGRTYHANNHLPYQLPDHKTKMAIRSDTHKGDGGFNELSFEDEKGQENMFLHAEKDQTFKVKNNQIASIDANALHTIGENQSVTVGNNVSQQVGGGMNIVVGAAGGAAAALLVSAMSNLTSQSASLLQQGLSIAGESSGDTGGGDESGSGANPLGGFLSALSSGGGSALSQLAGGVDSALGGISGAAQFALRAAGGASMASAGSSLASSLGSLVGGGVLNQFVATSLNQTAGSTASEQVGLVKVSTVGQVSMESVGHTKISSIGDTQKSKIGKTKLLEVGEAFETKIGKTNIIDVGEVFEITAGEKFVITVGGTRFQMDKSGVVTIEAPLTAVIKGGGGQVTVGPGPVLYLPALVPGGAPPPPPHCLKRMAQNSTPFVKV